MEMAEAEFEPKRLMIFAFSTPPDWKTLPFNVGQKNTQFYGKLFSSKLMCDTERITNKKNISDDSHHFCLKQGQEDILQSQMTRYLSVRNVSKNTAWLVNCSMFSN